MIGVARLVSHRTDTCTPSCRARPGIHRAI